MASYSGLCVLVRLLPFRGGQQRLPLSLIEVLRDPHVLKVGVSCYEDGKRLMRDYGLALTCTVDLRYLALRQRCSVVVDAAVGAGGTLFMWIKKMIVFYSVFMSFRQATVNNGLSLKSLAADLLNVSLDKSLELRCSDWEADQLTLEQVERDRNFPPPTLFCFFPLNVCCRSHQMTYAARDAQVSIALFLHLLGLRSEAGPASSSGSSYAELAARCQGLVDVPFRCRGDGEERTADGERRRRTRKPAAFESPESGDQQVPDPRKNNKRKPLGVGYSAR